MSEKRAPFDLPASVFEQLRACGIDLESPGMANAAVKVVCIPHSLGEGLNDLRDKTRDHVVMARVDSETLRQLDRWVESGAVGSRSHAAALFIREGLRVRAAELAELSDAISELSRARDRLRERAREVLGSPPGSGDDPGDGGGEAAE